MSRHLLLVALLLVSVSAGATELVVFLPAVPSPIEAQRRLETDPACGDLTITVVPKWRALEERLANKPALVLAPATFTLVPGWHPLLQAQVGGSDRFRYLLVAGEADDQIGHFSDATIGLVQELPRESAEAFIATLFPGLKPGRVRLPAKAEDVANLIGLELARVCVLTPDMLATARARLAGSLHVVARSRPAWCPMVYARDAAAAEAGHALLRVAPETLTALGLERLTLRDSALPSVWQAPEEGTP